MGRPQVLSPIAQNAPARTHTRTRSGVRCRDEDLFDSGLHKQYPAAILQNEMNDEGEAQPSRRRPVGRHRSYGSRSDNAGSSRTQGKDARRTSTLALSTDRRGPSGSVSSGVPTQTAPSGLVASAAAEYGDAHMGIGSRLTGTWAKGVAAAQAREDGRARAGNTRKASGRHDSSASSASSSSRRSSASVGRGQYGASDDSDDAASLPREPIQNDASRTPTLLRRATAPAPQGRQPPLQRLMNTQQHSTKQAQSQHSDVGGSLARSKTPEAQARRRITRQAIVEILSPMRAMRVARAGMKRKHGDGTRAAASRGQEQYITRDVAAHAMSSDEEFNDKGVGSSKLNASGSTWQQPDDEAEGVDGHIKGRPGHARRVSSSTYLRRNMRALALSDKDDVNAAPVMARKSSTGGRSTRTSSRASSFQRRVSGGSGSRKRSEQMTSEPSSSRLHADADGATFENEDTAEIERLLHQAPSWQLNRLNKAQLQTLHVRLGTWQSTDSVDLDLFSKQDLVEGIIKSRSADAKPATPSSASTSFVEMSCDTSMRSRRRSSAALSHSITLSSLPSSLSSDFTDESDSEEKQQGQANGAETDANDAGGEETEVEPSTLARQKGKAKANAAASPILHRLRHAQSRHKLHGGQANSVSSAAASRVPGKNQQTRTTYVATSPAKRRLRHQPSVAFAAASPVPTRARARNQSSSSSRRTSLSASRAPRFFQQRTLRTNHNGDLSIGEAMQGPSQRQPRAKSTTAGTRDNGAAPAEASRVHQAALAEDSSQDGHDSPSEEQDDLDDHQGWEDDSPPMSWLGRRVAQAPPPRRAKLRVRRQIHQASASAAEDSEALVEEALGHDTRLDDDDEDKMSMSEQSTDDASRHAPLSDMSLDDTQDTIVAARGDDNGGGGKRSDDEEEESELSDLEEPSENEVQASPSKVRRLRNGKVRYPTTPTAEKSQMAAQLMPDVPESDEDADDMPDLSLSTLSKLKRNSLLDLCQDLRIEHDKDATRAVLIEALLAHENLMPPDSSRTTRPVDSAASTRTARAAGSNRSGKNRRGSKAKGSSDVPLLLRSGSMPTQSQKPGTPVPSQQGEEELNGLDLESLDLVDKEIPFSKLEKLEKIGSGGFKDVYVGKYHITKKTSKKVAICDIRDQLSEMDIKELTLLRDLKHENIVRFIGVSIPPPEMRLTPCIIVSELCSNGDLYDYIRNTDPPPEHDIFRMLLETARGLEYLHTRTPAIIHRDCKSTNVLVTRNKTAKINDFGLARVRNDKRSKIKSLVGTVNWQAVELWQPKPSYNEKVDVWSAGMTFWETLQWHQPEKKYPFQDMNEHQIYQDVGQRKLRPPTISIRRHYGCEIVDLLDRMWDHNAKDRPTMTQVCTELEALVAMKREMAADAADRAAVANELALDSTGRRGSHANGLRKTSR